MYSIYIRKKILFELCNILCIIILFSRCSNNLNRNAKKNEISNDICKEIDEINEINNSECIFKNIQDSKKKNQIIFLFKDTIEDLQRNGEFLPFYNQLEKLKSDGLLEEKQIILLMDRFTFLYLSSKGNMYNKIKKAMQFSNNKNILQKIKKHINCRIKDKLNEKGILKKIFYSDFDMGIEYFLDRLLLMLDDKNLKEKNFFEEIISLLKSYKEKCFTPDEEIFNTIIKNDKYKSLRFKNMLFKAVTQCNTMKEFIESDLNDCLKQITKGDFKNIFDLVYSLYSDGPKITSIFEKIIDLYWKERNEENKNNKIGKIYKLINRMKYIEQKTALTIFIQKKLSDEEILDYLKKKQDLDLKDLIKKLDFKEIYNKLKINKNIPFNDKIEILIYNILSKLDIYELIEEKIGREVIKINQDNIMGLRLLYDKVYNIFARNENQKFTKEISDIISKFIDTYLKQTEESHSMINAIRFISKIKDKYIRKKSYGKIKDILSKLDIYKLIEEKIGREAIQINQDNIMGLRLLYDIVYNIFARNENQKFTKEISDIISKFIDTYLKQTEESHSMINAIRFISKIEDQYIREKSYGKIKYILSKLDIYKLIEEKIGKKAIAEHQDNIAGLKLLYDKVYNIFARNENQNFTTEISVIILKFINTYLKQTEESHSIKILLFISEIKDRYIREKIIDKVIEKFKKSYGQFYLKLLKEFFDEKGLYNLLKVKNEIKLRIAKFMILYMLNNKNHKIISYMNILCFLNNPNFNIDTRSPLKRFFLMNITNYRLDYTEEDSDIITKLFYPKFCSHPRCIFTQLNKAYNNNDCNWYDLLVKGYIRSIMPVNIIPEVIIEMILKLYSTFKETPCEFMK